MRIVSRWFVASLVLLGACESTLTAPTSEGITATTAASTSTVVRTVNGYIPIPTGGIVKVQNRVQNWSANFVQYAFAEDGTGALGWPTKGYAVTGDFILPALSSAELPDGAVITGVSVRVRHKTTFPDQNLNPNIDLHAQLLTAASAASGAAVTPISGATSDQTYNQPYQTTVVAATALPTIAQLRTPGLFRIRMTGERTQINTSNVTYLLDVIEATISYTLP